MSRYSYALFALALSLPSIVLAQPHDLGLQGTTFPITEPDIRAVIAEQISMVDFKKQQDRMLKEAKDYGRNLPAFALPSPSQTHTYYITPQAKVTQTVYYPALDQKGTLIWKTLAKKGTVTNPLKTSRPYTAFFVFDANAPDQVAFMKALVKRAPDYIRPVASAGDPTKIAKEMKTPIFRASPFFLKRFDLTQEPDLIRVGSGSHKLQIAITAFAPPFSIPRALLDVTQKELLGSSS